jgi:DNA-binding transcriptional ArsR family regulator
MVNYLRKFLGSINMSKEPLRTKIARYSALSHVTRLKILNHLMENPEKTFQEIETELGYSPYILTYHLGVLKKVGLLSEKPAYSVTETGAKVFTEPLERVNGEMIQNIEDFFGRYSTKSPDTLDELLETHLY